MDGRVSDPNSDRYIKILNLKNQTYLDIFPPNGFRLKLWILLECAWQRISLFFIQRIRIQGHIENLSKSESIEVKSRFRTNILI